MNIKLKAAGYTAGYIIGGVLVGAGFVLVDHFFGTTAAIGVLCGWLVAGLAQFIYKIKLSELERGK